MNIAYIITRADAVGGASIHVRDLARAMIERGRRATVLVGGSGAVTDQLAGAGVPFRTLRFLKRSIHPLEDLRAVGEIEAALGEMRPDLVSTHTAKAGWVGRAAAARLGLPALYTPHGWPFGGRFRGPLAAVFAAAERVAARWTDAVICVSEEEKRLALSKRIAPAGMLHVVHNAVRDVPAPLRADPGASPVKICMVARFEAPKDHETLIEALRALSERPWSLELVGDGPRQDRIRRLAAAMGLAGRVRFHGYQPDPAPVLAAAQLFVLSSRSEGFPRSILEAMRAGLPVVASDVGGAGEAVEHGVSGLLVPPGDPAALAGAIGRLLEDPARRREMGAAARAAFESRFRFETMVEKTAAIYATVLDRAKRKGRTA